MELTTLSNGEELSTIILLFMTQKGTKNITILSHQRTLQEFMLILTIKMLTSPLTNSHSKSQVESTHQKLIKNKKIMPSKFSTHQQKSQSTHMPSKTLDYSLT